MDINEKMVRLAIAVVGVVAVICGCGREGGQGEKPVPKVPAQPAEERQAAAPSNDLDAITNISAMTDMEYASLDGGKAPQRMVEIEKPSGEAAKWFECENDPTWFTNSVGERISVERYCAIANVEGGRAAECSFDGRYQRCGADMTLRLAEFYVHGECRVGDSGNGEVVDGSDERIIYHAWKIRDDLYLLFEENNVGTMRMRDYIMVMFDGSAFCRLVQFESQPSDEQMNNVLLARTNAAALNNVAVMIDRDEADRRAADERYVVQLLEMAALGGEPVACRNLAYYYKRKENAARSATWSKLAATVARRRGRNAVGKLPLRPLNEWPVMSNADALFRQAETIATWLRGHLKDTKWVVAANGFGKMSVTGLVRGHRSDVGDCSFGFDLNDTGTLICRGELPTAVPEARLAEVQKLLFCFESDRNVSLEAVALDKDRKVQCFATVPLLALRDDPTGTIRRLSTRVLPFLLELSDAVGRVCRAGQKPEEAFEAAEYPHVVARALDPEDHLEDAWDATSEAEEVIESWFKAWGIKYKRGIETELAVYYRDKGDVEQGLQECFVMCGKTVLAQCRLNLVVPKDRRQALMDYILSYNATRPGVTLHLAYAAEPGDTVFFQYLMPISILEARTRNSVAKVHFDRMLDIAHRFALEKTPQIHGILHAKDK